MVGQAEGPFVLGIDLGGTKILAGVVDANHQILGRAKRSTPAKEGAEALMAALTECGQEALLAAEVPAEQVVGVGVGSPGPLDTEAGVIRSSPNLNVREFPIGPGLAKNLGKPVLVRNDVRAGGWGEFRLGAGHGYQDVLAAFVGTGIGGCVIRQGEILTGATGNAGEIGHLIVKANGPKCGCGNRGCLEALASRTAITKRVHKALRKGTKSVLAEHVTSKNSRLKSRELSAAYQDGDPLAVGEVERSAWYLGHALCGLINVLGPEIVVVGGGVVEALGDPYVDLVRASAREQAMADPDQRVQIATASLGDDAGVLGASLMARDRFAR
ncbi:ROK family protein [soil metagenome]